MELKNLEGKMIRLTNVDGYVFEGEVGDYIYPDDNEPEGVEGIIIDYPIRNDGYQYSCPVQFNLPDIESIDVIE